MKVRALLFCCAALTAQAEEWWAFQPLKTVSVPQPKHAQRARTDIDRFILAALEAKGLLPNPDTDAVTLLRRLSFDLTGLPPSPEMVETFAKSEIRNPKLNPCSPHRASGSAGAGTGSMSRVTPSRAGGMKM